MLRTWPSSAKGAGSIPGAKISHASRPKKENIKQKQYCHKLSRDFRNGPHQENKESKCPRYQERRPRASVLSPWPALLAVSANTGSRTSELEPHQVYGIPGAPGPQDAPSQKLSRGQRAGSSLIPQAGPGDHRWMSVPHHFQRNFQESSSLSKPLPRRRAPWLVP